MGETDIRPYVSRLKSMLRQAGLLPFTDRAVPSLVSTVAGGPVSGSWWGHPSGGLIYRVGEALDSDPDVLVLKLWRGKRTLIDRSLWPALIRIGRARAGWQVAGLGEVASRLLVYIDRQGSVRSDRLPPDFAPGSQGFSPALRRLEQRLLVLTRSVHTSTGAHALEGESWSAWGARTRTPAFHGPVALARLMMEDAARRLSPGVDPRRVLPWG